MDTNSKSAQELSGATSPIAAVPSMEDLRSRLIQKLSASVPSTFGGLPVGIYRADLLTNPSGTHAPSIEPEDYTAAFVELSFGEGFPTLPNGAPFWYKMDFEPAPAYSAFQLYLEQIESGPRSMHHIAQVPELKRLYNGHTFQLVQEWSVLYYWRDRAKAHDIYKEAAFRQIRARRAMHTEDRHYEIADRLLEVATQYMATPKFVEEMTPKSALEALKLAASLQRVSVGLPAGGPLPAKDEERQAPGNWEFTIRQVAQRNDTTTFDEAGNLLSDQELSMHSLLDDPAQAHVMQEVIIRMSAASKGNKRSPFSARQGAASRTVDTPSDSAVIAADPEDSTDSDSDSEGVEDIPFMPRKSPSGDDI